MCGIFVFLQKKTGSSDIRQEMIRGLRTILNRGYDSIGISFVGPDILLKTCESMTEIETRLMAIPTTSRNGMGHTRWATHGEVNLTNCHPHTSEDGRFLIVHNGILKNDHVFSGWLRQAGIVLRSATDSEMIVQWIGHSVKERPTDIELCVREMIDRMEGNFAFVLQDTTTPDRIYCGRRGNPLLIGRREDAILICSEKSGLIGCDQILEPFEDHVMVLTAQSRLRQEDGLFLTPMPMIDSEPESPRDASWTAKEIREQPGVVETILAARVTTGGEIVFHEWDDLRRRCREGRHLFLVGCGTSYNAALASCHWFRESGMFETVQAHDAVDFDMDILPTHGEVIWLFISQSGETLDLLVLFEKLPPSSLVIGFFNVEESLLWRRCDYSLNIMAGHERGVASTKSFTCQVLHLYLFSRWLEGRTIDAEVRRLPDRLREVIRRFPSLDRWKDLMGSIHSMLVLGRRNGWIAAIESSLKMKELSRIHTEAYSSGSLKHGPFALLDENMPVLYIHTEDNQNEKTILSLREILSRKSSVFLLAPASITGFPFFTDPHLHLITYPPHPIMGFLFPILLLQELSIRLAIAKGFCVDFPRNLAKTVTVE